MLLGRGDELDAIDALLAAARRDSGGAVFAVGEPGIGKSALLAAARARAEAAGMVALEGAAWEGGGAPAYWPWRQVLRDAARRCAEPRVEAALARIGPGAAGAGADADPSAARFDLLEEVVDALRAAAGAAPVALLLDDLHAADLPSLDLLALLARELPRCPIALVGTWRVAEAAARVEVAARLARAGRSARVFPLRALTVSEIGELAGPAADAARLHERTEGNPLFVLEALRSRGDGPAVGGVGAAIRDHLALLRPEVRDALSAVSVLGREFDLELLAAVAGVELDAASAIVSEAASAGVVTPREDRWSFAHVLVRDELHASLPPSRRGALRRAAGAALLARDRFDVRGALHLLAAPTPDTLDRALDAGRAAALHAAETFAFEVSAEVLAAAAAAAESAGRSRDACDLLVELGDARTRAAQVGAGKTACLGAARIARELGDGERLARAAIGYSTELSTAGRDPEMVALLEDAMSALPPGRSALRVRVLARLAAALAPAVDPAGAERVSALATSALDEAALLGDDEASLYAHRYVSHAYGYMVPLSRGLELAERTCELARRLRRPLDALDAHGARIAGLLAARDLAGAEAARAELLSILEPVRAPHYAWRSHGVRATEATLAGRFDEAERHLALVRAIAQEHDIPRAAVAAGIGAHALANARRDPSAEYDDRLILQFVRRFGNAGGIEAWVLARAGRLDDARAALATAEPVVPGALFTTFGYAEAAVLLGDRDAALRVVDPVLRLSVTHPLAMGPTGAVLALVGATAGNLCRLVGRCEEAVVLLESSLSHARSIRAVPFVVHSARGLAAALRARRGAGDLDRADALAEEAETLAMRIGIPPEPRAPVTVPAVLPSTGEPPELRREGERWRVRWRGREVTVANVKGLRYLEVLLAAPDREVHVHELIGDEAEPSDAGEVLDEAALRAYRGRLKDLGGELDLATRRNDIGRAERLRAEVDALTEQLAGACGLGGRARRAGSTVERARINVQRRIKDAIGRIAAEDAGMGRYLEGAVHTGVFCRFSPFTL